MSCPASDALASLPRHVPDADRLAPRLPKVTPANQMRRALALVLLLMPAACLAELLDGQVVGVHDGDTITLLDASSTQHKVRLAGIDAPELRQAFGRQSKEELSRQVFGKRASVDWSKRDRYGRLVGKVLVDGLDANLAQVSQGLAWHYAAYAAEQPPADRATYKEGQDRARVARLGLWVDDEPIPPWNYRRKLARQEPGVCSRLVASLFRASPVSVSQFATIQLSRSETRRLPGALVDAASGPSRGSCSRQNDLSARLASRDGCQKTKSLVGCSRTGRPSASRWRPSIAAWDDI